MTSLLAGLPPEFLRQNIERQLVPGCVIRIEVNFEQITKPKYLVLVATDNPDYLSFFINSEINGFIIKIRLF